MRRLALAAALFCTPALSYAEAGDPEVKLLSPGSGKLAALRFQPKKGTKQSLVMDMRMNMAIKLGTMDMPATKIPLMSMTANIVITDVAPDGDILYDFKLVKFEVNDKEPGLNPMVVGAMKDALKGAEGISGKARVTTRGFTRELDLQIPPSASPQLRQVLDSMRDSMRQFTAPLPAEPVGPGARWQTRYKLKQQGMELSQIAENELTAVKGNTAKLRITLTQSADRQAISPPGLPAGAQVELLELKSSGGGESEIDLAYLVPVSAKMKLKSLSKAHIKMQGQEQDMSTDVDVSVEVRKK